MNSIFLFIAASRPALGPTQPPIEWGTAAGAETDHSRPSSAELKNAWNYTFTSPIRLDGVVLTLINHRENFPLPPYVISSIPLLLPPS